MEIGIAVEYAGQNGFTTLGQAGKKAVGLHALRPTSHGAQSR
jgi:hypothetical protein